MFDSTRINSGDRPNLRISYAPEVRRAPSLKLHTGEPAAAAVMPESREAVLARRLEERLSHRLAGIRAALSTPGYGEAAQIEGVHLDILA